MIRIIIRFSIILCVLALFVPVLPVSGAAEEKAAQIEYYGYGLLTTKAEKTAYDAISDGIQNCDTEIAFTIDTNQSDLTVDAFKRVLNLICGDHPEFFWFDGSGNISIMTTGTKKTFVFTPSEYSVNGQTVTKSNVNKFIKEVDKAVAKALEDMPTDRDLAKIHYLHDYVAENVDYVFTEDDQTIYGALVEGQAVCAGYARAYQYLLCKAGIKAWYVTGHSINPTTMSIVAHAWNLVYLDGRCYYTDVTWDDQGEVFHAYYMISKAEMGQSHFPDREEDLPASCGHKDLDYFEVHNGYGTGIGMLKDSYNATELAAYMHKISSDTWSCHVEDLTGGGSQTFVTWLKQNEQAIASALGIQGAFRWKLSILWDEYQIEFQSLPNYHKHDMFLIGHIAKAPTCTEAGHKAYYVCNSCGAWFENFNATGEIYDKDSIKIPALDHTYSKKNHDGDEHWQECKDCGMEQLDSREAHYDQNKNGRCDVCNAQVEVATEPTTVPTTTPTAEPTTTPTAEPTLEPTIVPSTDVTTEPTESTTEAPTDESVTQPSEPTTEPSSEPSAEPSVGVTDDPSKPAVSQQTSPVTENGGEEQRKSTALPFLIAGGIVAVGAATTGAVLLFRKRP